MALEMKPACENCDAGLEPEDEAFICSYECTFCAACSREMASCCGGPGVRRHGTSPRA